MKDYVYLPLHESLTLPSWINEVIDFKKNYLLSSERMELVITLSRENITRRTGGPFAAAIFDREGKLISAGVNCVVPENTSLAHAELMAMLFAQKQLGVYSLWEKNLILTSLCEPCGMCATGILWGGIRSLEYAATSQDAESIGFDEGLKPKDWQEAFKKRGIEVTPNIAREKALALLRQYDGPIYNGGLKKPSISLDSLHETKGI